MRRTTFRRMAIVPVLALLVGAAAVPAAYGSPRAVLPAVALHGGSSPFKLASSAAHGIITRGGTRGDRLASPLTSPLSTTCAASCSSPLFYHEGGSVMRKERLYLIEWEPSEPSKNGQEGTTFTPLPGEYMKEVGTFLKDVAAESGKLDNVYSVDTLYGEPEASRPGEYSISFGGEYLDTKQYPARSVTYCPEGKSLPPAGQPCIADTTGALQLSGEVAKFVEANGLPTGLEAMYFVLTPHGVNSCAGFEHEVAACNTNYYCAYHSAVISKGKYVVYANMPYDDVEGCRTPDQPHESAADDEINTLSHENNEAITDPLGNAWFDYGGNEVGDKCTYPYFDPSSDSNAEEDAYGALLGGTSTATYETVEVEGSEYLVLKQPGNSYNQAISGGHYLLQREWSNAAGGCVAHAPRVNASFVVTQQSETELTFNGGPSSTEAGRITEYVWSFSAGSGPVTGQTVKRTLPGPGTYKATLSVKNDSGESGADEQEVTINVGSGGLVTSTTTTALATTTIAVITAAAPVTTTTTTTATATPATIAEPSHAHNNSYIAKLLGLPANGRRLSGLGAILFGRAECPPACAVTLKLSAKVTRRVHGHRVTRWRPVGTARIQGTPKGAVYVKAPGPGMRELLVSLNAAGRALLRKHRRLAARLLVSVEESSGASWTIERHLTLTSRAKSARNRSRAARRRRR